MQRDDPYVGRTLYKDNSLAAQLNQKIVEKYLDIDDEGNFLSPPSTDDELHEFIWLAFGIWLPRKVITPGHRAPFDFVADMFFERTQTALAFANRTGGKAVCVKTPILTTVGWKTVGDVSVGDYVFAVDGSPTKVLSKSPVYEDHDCYELDIDGVTVIADAGHLWEVTRAKESSSKLMTTEEIHHFLINPPKIGYKNLLTIRKASPLQMTTSDVPIHPYALGVYLGDGTRGFSSFTSEDPEIAESIRNFGDVVTKRKRQADRSQMYNISLLRSKVEKRYGKDYCAFRERKYVPSDYLMGSAEQRLLLLQGLMDTDGCRANTQHYRCEFDSTDVDLADAVYFLVASLGGNPRYFSRGPGKFNGELYKDRYRVTFHPESGWNPFRLQRKSRLVRVSPKHTNHRIKSVRPCAAVPVQCLEVEHDEHLFLITKKLIPTHNTFAVAILNSLDLLFKPGCEVASAGAVLDQAEKCYRYFQEFNELPFFTQFASRYVLVTGKPLLGKSVRSKTQFGNGSILEIIAGTQKGFRGPHPHKSRVDEIDEIEWDIFQTALSMSHSSKGIRGQDAFTSTRQKSDGPMNRLLTEAVEKGIEVYEWNIWEALEQCTRRCVDDPVHGTCPVLKFCQGKAHDCAGFYKIDDFIKKVRLIDRHHWNTEWLNKEPLGDKMVFHQFSETKHIMTPEKLRRMTNYDYPQFSWERVSGLDFGSSPGNPFVYVKFCKLPNGAWLQFYEYHSEQRLLRDHALKIKESPLYSSSEAIYADHDAQDRLELNQLGIYTRSAVKGPNSIRVGVDKIGTMLAGRLPDENPELYIWHNCKATLYEYKNYMWPTLPDGKVNTRDNPMDRNNHCIDASRYALFSHMKNSGGYRYRKQSF